MSQTRSTGVKNERSTLRETLRICLFGASPSHPNLGVSALCFSVLSAIARRYPDADVTVFDFGTGLRDDTITSAGTTFHFKRLGANLSRRFYRRDSFINMRVSAALGGLNNPGISAISKADAMLDISGGDSFSDIYGGKRFKAMVQAKQLTLQLMTPLILLPQTYGPFNRSGSEVVAQDIVRRASMALARDSVSFVALKSLLGSEFNPERHFDGVDVAFSLPTKKPETIPRGLELWLAERSNQPVVGINVSGLIHNQPDAARKQFGFLADYKKLIKLIVSRFLQESDARIVLVPHVLARLDHYESDIKACQEVAEQFQRQDRIFALNEPYDSMQMKWIIAQLDFFCGTRMHSTIAGLSSQVPTAAIAYSKKTLGVFDSCGQPDCVVDPRHQDTGACVNDVWRVWIERDEIRHSLNKLLPSVSQMSTDQLTKIFDHIEKLKAVRLSRSTNELPEAAK